MTAIPESGETRGGRGVAEAQELGPLGRGWDCGWPTYWMLDLQRVGFFSRSWNQGGEAKQRDRARSTLACPFLLLSNDLLLEPSKGVGNLRKVVCQRRVKIEPECKQVMSAETSVKVGPSLGNN